MMKSIQAVCVSIASFVFAVASMAADPFTVAGIPVDATGDNAIAAQTQAISEGQALAAQVLTNRLTLKSERASKGLGALDTETIARMIRALEISNEKRSANRYLGDITVAFNPSQVQQLLESRGLTMISTQSRARLVLPVLAGRSLWSENGWSLAFQNPAYAFSLTPLRTIRPEDRGGAIINAQQATNADMDALRAIGQRYGVSQILVASASPGPGGVSVDLVDVALDTGQKRNVGRLSGLDYNQAAWAVVEKLEDDWKQASVSLAENAESITVSVLYRSLRDWQNLQDAINGSAQIQDARLDALSKDGALMTLTYGGDFERLRNELAFKGVEVRRDPAMGVVMTRSGRF